VNRRNLLVGLLLAVSATALIKAAKQEQKSLPVVPKVDLNRYAGKWYEIARYPNRFEKECARDITATYTVKSDGKISVVNQCTTANNKVKRAEGEARVNSAEGSKLKVRFAPSFLSFIPFVWADYWVLDLAPDYSHAIVGEPGRDYLWILSRSPRMEDSLYRELENRIRGLGYDPSKLIRVRN
jgi:apolipoprotein D and lipocalin family protein